MAWSLMLKQYQKQKSIKYKLLLAHDKTKFSKVSRILVCILYYKIGANKNI